MSATYTADNFIGKSLIAGMDGVKCYRTAEVESSFIGTFSKGKNIGTVISFIAAGKGTYTTNAESWFWVRGILSTGVVSDFWVPMRKGYFDKATMIAMGLQSDEQLADAAAQKTKEADPIAYYWAKIKLYGGIALGISTVVSLIKLFK